MNSIKLHSNEGQTAEIFYDHDFRVIKIALDLTDNVKFDIGSGLIAMITVALDNLRYTELFLSAKANPIPLDINEILNGNTRTLQSDRAEVLQPIGVESEPAVTSEGVLV